MASKSRSADDSKPGPLSFMTKVSDWVSVYRPNGTSLATSTAELDNDDDNGVPPPKLIIFVAWMGAGSWPIAKFIRIYQTLYPSAQILLIKTSLKHLIWQPNVVTPDVRPAVSVLRAFAATMSASTITNPPSGTSSSSSPQILVHSFSSGGSAMLSHLRTAYGANFPSHVTIFDSGPGLFTPLRATAGSTVGIQPVARAAALPIVLLITVLYRVWYLGRADGMRRHFDVHNNVKGEVRRAYIYSEPDHLTHWTDVEKHADVAEEKGYVVRLEKFAGTTHVAHIRGDEQRYWKIVRETWRGRIESRL